MLIFVGLGLYDEYSITLRGKREIKKADKIYAEFYTTKLVGTDLEKLEKFHQKPICRLSRSEVEKNPSFLEEASEKRVVFLVGGDPMISTTHVDLRLRAMRNNIQTKIIHAPSVETAVCGSTGLQNYRFGKSTTLPFPKENWNPNSPYKAIINNLNRDLHTLIYLDITKEKSMDANKGADILKQVDEKNRIENLVGVARLGSSSPKIYFGNLKEIEKKEFGSTPHCLVAPASLHPIEEESLKFLSNNHKT